jgi:hypothetical protein
VAQGGSLTACVAIRMPTHGESAGHRSLPGPTLAFHHKAKKSYDAFRGFFSPRSRPDLSGEPEKFVSPKAASLQWGVSLDETARAPCLLDAVRAACSRGGEAAQGRRKN